MSYIGIRVFDKIDSKNKIRQEIISKLTEEELSNVNINELVEDITGGIKYAKKVDKKGNGVEDVIYSIGRYEGNGYTIVNNGGGIVDEALEILDYILDKDSIMLITANKKGEEKIEKAKKKPTIEVPIVVLVNENTASSSEIFAAATVI